jgi:FMN phosphatase YigB (HAD superfamily)
MIIIFDLDYTLLNTKKFKEDLPSVFFMASKEWADYYKKNFKNKKINYSFKKNIEYFRKRGLIKSAREEKRIVKRFNYFIKKINNYLFPEVESVLKNLKNKRNKLILLTFGDKEFHKLKVDNLKIKKYFDLIVYEDKNKSASRVLKKIKNKRTLLVNDNLKESEKIIRFLGKKVELFLIKGPYSGKKGKKIKTYKNISGLLKLKL